MHSETQCVKCTLVGVKEEVDVLGVWDFWYKAWHMEVGTNLTLNCKRFQGWPTGLNSRTSRSTRRKGSKCRKRKTSY